MVMTSVCCIYLLCICMQVLTLQVTDLRVVLCDNIDNAIYR